MRFYYEVKIKELEDCFKRELDAPDTRVSPLLSTENGSALSIKMLKRRALLGELERVRKVAIRWINALENKTYNLEWEV